ncbi:hypothetical protein C900_05782 [Fulvivirga imtechensis AK7]|uniref:Uncharacterized protein n=1 Tax=Fulvivirga imtechensis AK7 TaxID=1237149 RepID=L8JIY1_9BACT|nr:hypothetical protein C900_05782 [Fulvivirga imtechensis AK7]
MSGFLDPLEKSYCRSKPFTLSYENPKRMDFFPIALQA